MDDIVDALAQQTVTVPDTNSTELVLAKRATALAALIRDRAQVAAQLEDMLDAHPLT